MYIRIPIIVICMVFALWILKKQGVFGFKDGCNSTHDFCFPAFTTEKSPETKSQNGLDQGNMFVKWDFPEQKLATGPTTLYFGKISRFFSVPQGSTQSTQNLILSGTPYPKIPRCLALTYVSIFRYLYISYIFFFPSTDRVHGPPDSTFHCRTSFCAILQIWTSNEIPILTSVIK